MARKKTKAAQKQAQLTLREKGKWEKTAAKHKAVIAGMKTDSERAAHAIDGLRREMKVVQEKADKAKEETTKAHAAALGVQAEAHRTALGVQAEAHRTALAAQAAKLKAQNEAVLNECAMSLERFRQELTTSKVQVH